MRVDPSKVFIDNQADLDDLMADAMGAPWVAVDTEFERIRTFFPATLPDPDGHAPVDRMY